MSEPVPTLRQLLELPEPHLPQLEPAGWEAAKHRIHEEVKSVTLPATLPDLVPKVFELVDIKVPTLLVTAWKTSDKVQAALAESAKSPEKPIQIALAEHTIKSHHQPTLEVRVDRLKIRHPIKFDLNVDFKLSGGILRIIAGKVDAIQRVKGEWKAEFKIGDVVIAQKPFTPIAMTHWITL